MDLFILERPGLENTTSRGSSSRRIPTSPSHFISLISTTARSKNNGKNDPTSSGTKQTADQRGDAIFKGSQIFQTAPRPRLCHCRHLRCHWCARNSAAADRVGSRYCDGVAALLGA